MSNTQFIFLKRTKVPSVSQWQASIDSLDFNTRLTLDPDLQQFEESGFSPCKWGDTDQNVGFEIHYEPVQYLRENIKDLEMIAGDNDYCISLSWRGSTKDCAAALIASCALAKDFDATVSFQGEAPESLDQLIADAQDIIANVEYEVSEEKTSNPFKKLKRMFGGS